MTLRQAQKTLAKAVAADGRLDVARRIGCTPMQVTYLADGRRKPGLRIACAIEDAYQIPVRAWVKRKRAA